MNKYFKLEDAIGISDSDFAYEAIAYMDRVGLGNCDEFLNEFERLCIADEVCNPMVEECFNIIQNLMEIGRYIKDYRDPIPLFDKAVDIRNQELQNAVDYDDRDYDQDEIWESADDYLNWSDRNYAYAQKIILDILSDTFILSKDASRDVLSTYKKVAIPKFEIIKTIKIDGAEFSDIRNAQEYLNDYLVDSIDDVFHDELSFDIKVVLADKLEVFEVTFDLTDVYVGEAELSADSLLDILLRPYDYFGDELPIQSSTLCRDVYTIELDRYKEYDVGSVDFSFLYESIYTDMDKLLDRQKHYSGLSEDVVEFAFDVLESNYKNDINILYLPIDDELCTINNMRNEIFKKHDFSITYDEYADKDSYYLYSRIIILKLLAVKNGYQLKQKYTFPNHEKVNDEKNILEFMFEVEMRLRQENHYKKYQTKQ